MNKLQFFAGLLFILFISSCGVDKNEQLTPDSPISFRTVTKLNDTVFTKIGTQHNQKLGEIFSTIIRTHPTFATKSALSDYIRDYNYAVDSFSTSQFTSMKFDVYDDFLGDSMNVFSDALASELDELYVILEDAESLSELNSLVNAKITSVKNDNTISAVNYNVLMSALAVLKASSDFWFDTNYGGSGTGRGYMVSLNNYYPNFFPTPPTPVQAWSGWRKIVGADAVGAAFGMLEWSVVGIWTGAGEVGFLIGGAVFGAVSGSCSSAAGLP